MLTSPHWINGAPKAGATYAARTRYRTELIPVQSIRRLDDNNWNVVLRDEVRAVTPGQSTVLYEGERVVGGGIVVC